MLWIPNLTDIEIKDNVFLHRRKQDHFILANIIYGSGLLCIVGLKYKAFLLTSCQVGTSVSWLVQKI